MQTGSLTAAAVSAIRSACHAGTGSRELPEDFYTGGLETLRHAATEGGHDFAEAMVLLVGLAAVTKDLDGFLRAAFLDMDVFPESTALDSVRRVLSAHLARTNPE